MSATVDADADEPNSALHYSIHEFIVEFLGSFVPGILFTAGLVTAIAVPLRLLVAAFAGTVKPVDLSHELLAFLSASKDTPSMIWIGVLLFGFVLSYVLGCMFSRLDPKVPDRKSFALLSKKGGSDKWLRDTFGSTSENNCEFPYPYLQDYLLARGHKHLKSLAPWTSDESNQRSKTYINRLKIRLQFHFPMNYRRIVRNEAHVRLATSTWFVARDLMRFSWIGGGIVIAALAVAVGHGETRNFWEWASWVMPSLIFPVTILGLSFFCKRSVEESIHYQRLREVFYVLETAYTAFRDKPKLLACPDIFAEKQSH